MDKDTVKDIFGKCENLFFGAIPDDLIELSKNLSPTEKAKEWHDYVQEEINKLGYKTFREVFIRLTKQKCGRIDLVAKKGNFDIAIELDYRTPRKKSIIKVKKYGCGLVLLRDPKIIRKK